jgi:hypothetical protein
MPKPVLYIEIKNLQIFLQYHIYSTRRVTGWAWHAREQLHCGALWLHHGISALQVHLYPGTPAISAPI